MDAVVLLGGRGTRLRTVVNDLPKPMAPVAGRPFLEYLLGQLREAGIDRVVLAVGWGAGLIQRYFAHRNLGLTLAYSEERDRLLGTAGALKLAEPMLTGNQFLVLNGDSYLQVDLNALFSSHQQTGAMVTLALARVPDTSRYGRVTLGADLSVSAFEEKGQAAGPGYINGGVYVFQKAALALIPAGRVCSLECDLFPRMLGHGLFGWPSAGYFVDIGIPEDFWRAQEELPAVRAQRGSP